ncbi:MAG TPA: hypothetical protein VEW67_10125 [Thermoleophilaceae bacterium]|nr:hypothetical protein [Thermoleophilaceae bacterium]
MAWRLAATATVLVALLAGCGGEPERAANGSPLPPAPEGVADGCREAAGVATFPVVCPTEWPDAGRPAKVRLRLFGSDVAYLLEAQTGFGSRSPVFHVLLGGQEKPFPVGFEGGGQRLRVTTRRVTTPIFKGDEPTGRRFVVTRPTRRVGTTRVHGHPAAVMKAPPYPQGGIHGDHSIVMWNENGHGYLISTHSETSRRAATRTAIQIARSTRALALAD